MPTRQQISLSLTWDQVTAFRLKRHHLVERAAKQALLSVAGDMSGAQAQLPSAAQLSLWTRVRDLQSADISEALRKRTLVKAACMRRTLFLVPSRDLAIFVRGTARRAEKEIRWTLGKGVPEPIVEAAIEATLGILDQPLTRPEIAERVSQALGVPRQDMHGGTGWGNRRKVDGVPVGALTFPVVELLHLAGARGVVCYGPYRGNEPTFVRADAWIPSWKDIPAEQAERMLLRRYLQAFGPATPADFAMWSGLTLTEARAIWAYEQARLATVDVEGWEAGILRKDLKELAQANIEGPVVRLLPYFDTFLLGHRERDHLLEARHRPSVYRPQGWIAPVVLVDGRVAAVWEQRREGNRLHVKVTKFGALSRGVLAGIREEAQNLARFLDIPDVDVQIL